MGLEKSSKVFEELRDYKFHDYGTDVSAIELIRKPYNGVFYHYGSVGFDDDNGVGVLKFSYTIINPGRYTEETLKGDQEFLTLLGDILTHILLSDRDIDEETRTNNTEEPNPQ